MGRVFVLAAACVALAPAQPSGQVPRAWDDRAVAGYRLPLPGLGGPPRLPTAAEYYALPEVNLKTYPVYAPDKEPANYMQWLREQEPKPLVEVSRLQTEADWIAAGREVFYGRELPRFSGSEHNLQLIRNPQILAAYRLQTTRDGVLIGLRYVVREKGKVELGTDTCSMCHVRVMKDGGVVEGLANNYTPFGPLMGDLTRRYAQMSPQVLEERRRAHVREDYRIPFLKDDPNLPVADLPAEEIAKLYDQHPLGVHGRTNTSLLYPVKIANLIGVQKYSYLDRTGTARQRDITDMMRYSASVGDVVDALTEYGDGPNGKLKLEKMGLAAGVKRTPDALLFALAKFIYSLQPPPNPNALAGDALKGKDVFGRGKCADCHSGPDYTNKKLTPAKGFVPSAEIRGQADVMRRSVETDPNLALKTRKATGYYRVPSLRMVWLESSFLHDGSIGTLEELFDPKRLQMDFRSSNWSASMRSHAVEGHRFGVELSPADRRALIAFLRTL
ncbi:MAG: hypothetical protein ACKV2U_16355 [Bryobacteraceae bacterium]